MLEDVKLTQIKMEELLSLEKENPFDITQYRVDALVIHELDKKRRGDNTKK